MVSDKKCICCIGDLTEDPEHPKTFWPSDNKCPKCYSWKGERDLDVDSNLAVLVSGNKTPLFLNSSGNINKYIYSVKVK